VDYLAWSIGKEMHWPNPDGQLWLDSGIVFMATVQQFFGVPARKGRLPVLAAGEPAMISTGISLLTVGASVGSASGDVPRCFPGRFGGKRALRSY